MNVLIVVIGGIVGAVCRVALDSLINHRFRPRWPTATLVINIGGSLILGIVTGLVLAHGLDADVRLLIGVGFCGGFTTFSTASFEVVRLLEEERVMTALVYLLGGCAACLAAAAIGLGVTGGL